MMSPIVLGLNRSPQVISKINRDVFGLRMGHSWVGVGMVSDGQGGWDMVGECLQNTGTGWRYS